MKYLSLRGLLCLALSSVVAVACGSSGDSGPKDAEGEAGVIDAASDGVVDSAAPVVDAASADAAVDSATDTAVPVATLFLAHAVNNSIYRYSISPGKDPVLNATITAMAPEGLAMNAKGELFAASENGSVLRFTTPLATPKANGKLENLGVTMPEELAFVDDELWIPSTNYQSCSATASKITRVAFDVAGAGTVAGMLQDAGIVVAGRGVLWDAPSRTLYLSNCRATDAIRVYKVAANRTITALTPATGGDINNPHGMVIAPWGELLVANANAAQVLRFTINATTGALTPAGTISGNGLNFPIGLGFAPWGELYVVNQGNGSLSRFTFEAGDGGRVAKASGTYQTTVETQASTHKLGWMLLVPGASTAPVIPDGGADATPDSQTDTGG